jgi:hypothetical protein
MEEDENEYGLGWTSWEKERWWESGVKRRRWN